MPRLAIPRPIEVLTGSTFGKYEIVRKLAVGGMAEIYLARVRGTAGFEKTVVLKRMLPRIAEDAESVAMFLQEARLAATLQHPNIADVYDVGEAHGSYFFTMEYIHGADARAIAMIAALGKRTVPLAVSTAIVLGTAMALDHAHRRNGPDGRVIHRDVSPSNILVSFTGAVKLVDFGIARATTSDKLTQTGTVKGKIPYMSPEQCQSRRLDPRTDLFSLGVVLYELTVGRRPFLGDSDYEVMSGIVEGSPPLPSSIDPSYPRGLETIVMKLLSRNVETRYQTADACVHDLECFIAANNLWLSANALSKYMRTLFPDELDAWERAAREGKSLDEHLVATAALRADSVPEHTAPASAFPAPAAGQPARTIAADPTDLLRTGHASSRMKTIAITSSAIVVAFALASLAFGRDPSPHQAKPPISTNPPPSPPPIAVPTARPAVEPAPVSAPPPANVAASDPGTDAPRPPESPATTHPARKRTVRTKPAARPATETSCDSNSPFWPGRSSERCQQSPTPSKTPPR
ncbi:MAG: serine/threonine protein kinase [Kofleriaceae bacterium]